MGGKDPNPVACFGFDQAQPPEKGWPVVKNSQLTVPISNAPPYRVLVVEDGKNAAEVISMFFEMEGMESAVALDGIKAVEAAETFRPHLICMDLALPRMDGFEAARMIREKFQEVIIVALCGGDEDVRRHAEEAGFDLYLAKPVTPDGLRNMLEKFLPNRHLTPRP